MSAREIRWTGEKVSVPERVPHDASRCLDQRYDVTLDSGARVRCEVDDPGEAEDDVDDGEDVVQVPVVLEETELGPKERMFGISFSEGPIEENIWWFEFT